MKVAFRSVFKYRANRVVPVTPSTIRSTDPRSAYGTLPSKVEDDSSLLGASVIEDRQGHTQPEVRRLLDSADVC
ncbi:hypothetical protein AWB80_08246 [Caballeronia pedi]|uniref:Uncharacterized protein n=1 Tax=Caballeronia pedi TaxID=1777141 RepID=A0A158E4Z7_9BURK|nr:hypothetical protein AWB80_08246 [Caballeronia pedi]